MSETVLQACGLSEMFGRGEGLVRAVDEVDLEACTRETVAVMGPSGCGKSTLLHLLGGLERASGGEIVLAGNRLDQMGERALARLRRTAIGFLFQAFHLIDELTARENVELPALLPALLAGRSPRAAKRQAVDLLERVGLADRATFLPAALSGGQRQRVAIARARQPRQPGRPRRAGGLSHEGIQRRVNVRSARRRQERAHQRRWRR